MTQIKSATEQFAEQEVKLRDRAIALEREIADQVQLQASIYIREVKPNAHLARLMVASANQKRADTTHSLSPKEAAFLENSTDPTARFEWGRSEVDRISKLVASRRTELKKVERALEETRLNMRRVRGEVGDPGSFAFRPEGVETGRLEQSAATGVSSYLGERVERLRSLASDTRAGRGVSS